MSSENPDSAGKKKNIWIFVQKFWTSENPIRWVIKLAGSHHPRSRRPTSSRMWEMGSPLRAPVAVIYRFARGADDIADEGDDAPQVRLRGPGRVKTASARGWGG